MSRDDEITGCMPIARAMAKKMCRPADREDAIQDAMLAATQAYDRWEGSDREAAFRSYVWPRLYGSILRIAARRPTAEYLEDGDMIATGDWLHSDATREMTDSVGEILASMPDRQREAITKRCENVGFDEIADTHNLSRDRVKDLYAAGLLRLRELMGAKE